MNLLELDELISGAVYLYTVNIPGLHSLFLVLGAAPIYALPLLLLGLFLRNRAADRRSSVKLFLAALLAWQVLSNAVGSFLYGQYGFRDRPFASTGATELFFERPEKAFPSDHASVLVVVTILLFAYGYKKLGWVMVAGTFLTVVGRVGIGFHYLGDMIGGATIGLIAYGIMRWLDRPLEQLFNRFRFLGSHD
jgi:undecaprenyl-diphosphatase